jgi:hypothetical protein
MRYCAMQDGKECLPRYLVCPLWCNEVEQHIVTCGGEVTMFLKAFQKKSECKEYCDTSSGVASSRDQPQGVCKVQDLRVDVA